jgi:hypothetical protein
LGGIDQYGGSCVDERWSALLVLQLASEKNVLVP